MIMVMMMMMMIIIVRMRILRCKSLSVLSRPKRKKARPKTRLDLSPSFSLSLFLPVSLRFQSSNHLLHFAYYLTNKGSPAACFPLSTSHLSLSRSLLPVQLASTQPSTPTLRRIRERSKQCGHYPTWLTSYPILPPHHPHPEHPTPRCESACILVAWRGFNLHTATKKTSCSSCIMLSTDSNRP